MNGLRGTAIETYSKKSFQSQTANVGLDRDSRDKLSVALSEARD
jgi:hypothetical protein